MAVTDIAMRKFIQRLRTMTNDQIKEQIDIFATNGYQLAEKHYQEAAYIVLPPKQSKALIAKSEEIREMWDGIKVVLVNEETK